MPDEQIALPGVGPRARRRAGAPAPEPALALPVARVALLTPLPHLDRPFDYLVPATLAEQALPGARVRVRLAGRLVDGVVLERVAASTRELQPIRSVHGPPVLAPAIAALCRAVADRYAGTFSDVVRAAVPPRHARAEARAAARVGSADSDATTRPGAPGTTGGEVDAAPAPGGVGRAGWARYDGGEALLRGLGGPDPARALWVAAPGEQVPARIADLVGATAARGRGAIVVVPDAADLARIAEALGGAREGVVRLSAELGPEARYAAFLRVLRGEARVVVGTRAAVFAPVAELGLVVVWDDGDDALSEPHAPGWHAREVAALRSMAEGASLVVGGSSVTLEAARMAGSGWLQVVALTRAAVRAAMPRVQSAADVAHPDPSRAGDRIPPIVVAALREGLERGPVLVVVPRAGYVPVLACQGCREPARCPQCGRAMRAEDATRRPVCPTHGAPVDWRCPLCAGEQVRAVVVGVRRTAEEFGRALPGATVALATGEAPLRALRTQRTLVVATPGAEPDPGPGGYAAAVLLDAAAALSRPGLRTAEEVLRRWFAAATRVRPAADGGRVLVVGEPDGREVQALIRWDPLGYAQRELDERRSLALPPAVRVAHVGGAALPAGEVVQAVCDELGERVVRRSGPLPVAGEDGGEQVAWQVATSIADGAALAAALQHEQARRSARRAPVVSVRLDPAGR
ncbi:MAG: primosomal protein N' [Candidatus Nanopelagicales bacterium]|nr:primosomal protein N' [Candidatus Nanopelagicales bacterium]